MDVLTVLVALAGGTLAGVIVDTYFWVRTTLRLREFDQEIQPRLSLLDDLSQALGPVLGLKQPLAVPQGVTVSEVRRTKKGSPFVVIAGKARFLSESQAKALQSGRPVPGLTVPPGAVGPPAFAPPAAPVESAPSSGELDYSGMAAELGIPEEQVRTFLARHGAGGGAAGPVPEGGAPPPSTGDPMTGFLQKLVNGELDRETIGQTARELLTSQQVQANGGSEQYAGAGGVLW